MYIILFIYHKNRKVSLFDNMCLGYLRNKLYGTTKVVNIPKKRIVNDRTKKLHMYLLLQP